MPSGWNNPNFKGDFTEGEWQDRKKNYPNLSWEEYRLLKDWDVEEKMKNKQYSFTEAYNKEPDTEDILTIDTEDITIPGLSDEEDLDKDIDPIHYHMEIEPFDYIHDNQMNFAEGNVVKYITRWRYKDGIKDLYKAKQYIEMLIAKEITDDSNRKK